MASGVLLYVPVAALPEEYRDLDPDLIGWSRKTLVLGDCEAEVLWTYVDDQLYSLEPTDPAIVAATRLRAIEAKLIRLGDADAIEETDWYAWVPRKRTVTRAEILAARQAILARHSMDEIERGRRYLRFDAWLRGHAQTWEVWT